MTRELELLFNIVAVWLLLEAYFMPPVGFLGSPWFVLVSYIILLLSIGLLASNVAYLIIQWTST